VRVGVVRTVALGRDGAPEQQTTQPAEGCGAD
jgi:hypothetical protein